MYSEAIVNILLTLKTFINDARFLMPYINRMTFFETKNLFAISVCYPKYHAVLHFTPEIYKEKWF